MTLGDGPKKTRIRVKSNRVWWTSNLNSDSKVFRAILSFFLNLIYRKIRNLVSFGCRRTERTVVGQSLEGLV